MTTNSDPRKRERDARSAADRAGLKLIKSTTRNADRIDHGLYALIDRDTGGTVHPMLAGRYACSLTIEQVEDWLSD